MAVDVVVVCLLQVWCDSGCDGGVSVTGFGVTKNVVVVCHLQAWCDGGCSGGVSATGLV